MTEGQNRDRTTGRLILFTTLWLTLFVLSVKISAAWATRSLSLMAESLHTLLASFSTILTLLKITAYDRPIGRSVYGHSKQETAIAFLLTAFLGFMGFNVWGLAAQQLVSAIQGELVMFPVRVSLPLLQLLGFVLATSLGLAVCGFYQARVLNNSALRFNARQLLKDVWLTLLILGGLLGVWWGLGWLDVVLAILLVLLAGASCWQIVNWQLPLLVQQTAIAPEVLAQIVHQVGGVTHCYKIQSRGIVGRLVYIQMHLILHPEFAGVTFLIVERIKGILEERYGPVEVTFYIDDDFTAATQFNSSSLAPGVNGQHDLN
ncbi:MAG TPA: cation transporter [Cyanobacteria bacterium UBA8803]|nr:cation transporter [Cyanobacteria bacterium UBA9273]HBL58962.1 cation transporter [Cyanobacteria bacterium UBA8803]